MKALILIACSLFVICFQTTIVAGEIIFNDSANAKVARIKAKSRVLKNKDKDGVLTTDQQETINGLSGNTSSECGSISLGNGKIGEKVKKIDVIILGDVINAGNNC